MKKILYLSTCGILLSFAAFAQYETPVNSTNTDNRVNSSNADNTEVNERDRNAGEPTADQAQNNLSDRQVMQKIRKAVMADKSLSTYAHNVKIIAEDGNVTLKGPVRSEAERTKIENIAIDVAGQENVTNEISIKKYSRRG